MHFVQAKGILSAQNGMNIYRGCSHGCIYCDARSTWYVVQLTLTTYDEELCRILEPDVCTTRRRAEVLCELRDRGIPTIVWLTPVLPFINDTEENLLGILEYCREAQVYGILAFGIGLTLRDGDRQYFYRKLDESFPGLKEKYIRTYGTSYELPVPNREKLWRVLQSECKTHNMICNTDELFRYMHTFDTATNPGQPELF
ncbi:MAG: hypothetical protein LKF96_08790 [Treponema sp.]|jgi:DNA repair photolyase|nr:hypothetical protein [Treponema sp.]